MERLREQDQSDWFERTKAYSLAAHPQNKQKYWQLFFSDEFDPSYDNLNSYLSGFKQF